MEDGRRTASENLPGSARRVDFQLTKTLRELGVDSLSLILVISRFCEEFEIPMETLDGNLGELRTVGDLLDACARIVELRNGSVHNG